MLLAVEGGACLALLQRDGCPGRKARISCTWQRRGCNCQPLPCHHCKCRQSTASQGFKKPAAGCETGLRLAGRYDRTLLGIFQVGNLTSVVEEAQAEVVILEEPEHLTWYHHGPRWTEKFDHVVSAEAHGVARPSKDSSSACQIAYAHSQRGAPWQPDLCGTLSALGMSDERVSIDGYECTWMRE